MSTLHPLRSTQSLPVSDAVLEAAEMDPILVTGINEPDGHLSDVLITIEDLVTGYVALNKNPAKFLTEQFPSFMWQTYILDTGRDPEESLTPDEYRELKKMLESCDFFWGIEYGLGFVFVTATQPANVDNLVFFGCSDRELLYHVIQGYTDNPDPETRPVEDPVTNLVHLMHDDGLPVQFLSAWEIEDLKTAGEE